ncbi:metallophosphoesterase family protein [Nonomuraea sp. NPDC050663]|uniref:metallophosphoesterase family protein n=1 Tax=Nonomuraea sp. NPDC050663 TaxID=3364370 RepID=UPI0037B8D64D
MRIAVLSDIHGVLPALEAVLGEPDVRAADRIVLTGDIAAGPMPVETLDLLVSLGERVVWVHGNADREVVEVAGGKQCDYAISRFAGEQLRPDQVELLGTLPMTHAVELGGLGRTVFFHGTPRKDDEVILVDSTYERWAEVLGDLEADTLVMGNTHMPFVRLVDRRVAVNPGSVGMPYGTAGAHWALLDGESGGVTLRRTPLDAEAVGDRLIAESRFEGIVAWVGEYIRENYSDRLAVEAMGRREGR